MSEFKCPKKPFAKTGVEVSVIGLGAMGFSQSYGPADREESFQTIKAALDSGVNFIDTADIYGQGHNEELVGEAIKRFGRDKFFLATKHAIIRKDGQMIIDSSPAYIKQACDASLKRLGVDQIDLYYQHRVDPKTPIEVSVAAMAELVKEGKVRFIGLSEPSAATIRRAHKIHPITAVQSELSLFTLDAFQNGVLDTCRELGIAFVPYSPLARAFLTGDIKSPDQFGPDDFRKTNPRFMGENFNKNLVLVEKVKEIAGRLGCTPGQLALAWILAQGDDMFPIPGTKRVKHMVENAEATKFKLSDKDVGDIKAIIDQFPAAGARYFESMMHLVNADSI